MKIAFATEDLKHVDAHFGWAKNIAVYDIAPEGYKFLEVIQFEGDLKEDGNEDKLGPKIDAVRDCAILYVAAIGGSGAARVVAAGIHPIKVNEPRGDHRAARKARGGAEGHAAALAAQGDAQGQGARVRSGG